MTDVSMRQMMEAGVHFGHQTRYWCPRMAPYIFGERNKIHIINLEHSLPMLKDAMNYLGKMAANGGTILFVGTKRQAGSTIQEQAARCGMPYVNHRWLGGMLTNFKTVKNSVARLKELDQQLADGKMNRLRKREALRVERERLKLERSLAGIKDMARLPDLLFIIDVDQEAIAVTEANKLSIPIVAIVDTNCSPNGIDYIIPGNDDAIRAIRLYANTAADAVIAGRMSTLNPVKTGNDEYIEVDASGAEVAADAKAGTPAKAKVTLKKAAPKVLAEEAKVTLKKAAPKVPAEEAEVTLKKAAPKVLAEEAEVTLKKAAPKVPAEEAKVTLKKAAPKVLAEEAEVTLKKAAPKVPAEEAEVTLKKAAPKVPAEEAKVTLKKAAPKVPAEEAKATLKKATPKVPAEETEAVVESAKTVVPVVTAAMVKELRERTGAGMMDCKEALGETDGDLEAAVELLRKKGAASAEKKAGRIAAEGMIASALSGDGSSGTLVEVNCETDFVGKDANFQAFASAVAQAIADNTPASDDGIASTKLADGRDIETARQELIAKIGENVSVRRFETFAGNGGQVSAYLHGNRIGVLVELTGGNDQLGKDLAMHIAASNPMCVSAAEMSADVMAKEKDIFMAQAQESGKSDNIIEKMVQGRVAKFLKENTLLGQFFVKNPEQTIAKLLEANGASVTRMARFEVGEGIEKKVDDFVAEVMAQANKDGDKDTS